MSWVMLCAALALVLEGVQATATSSSSTWVADHNNATNASLTVSKWWRRRDPDDPRAQGCQKRPWICNQGQVPPFRMRCCRNRCVDILSDPNHCGQCLIRCPYTWQCCFGLCRNINRNPLHCGKCFNRCPFGVRIVYGSHVMLRQEAGRLWYLCNCVLK
ncbi:stigma-specific STIG1-like protein 4 [Punica granatum]|uniref:Stigma-specific STIG1-like protein 4 n=1 Tax=Punica granatum TaxID=22663 RepID=A0A6P8EG92_PUNGR|nr:stigma-specific STIG1-like protein 4 [Punica granatum]